MSRSLLSVGTQRKEQWTVPVWSAMFKLGFLQSLGPPLGCSSAKLPFSVMAGNLAGPWSSAATDMFCSSTAGEGAKAPPRWTALGQPHTSPPMQGGGTGLQAKVQYLSQMAYIYSLSLSLHFTSLRRGRVHSREPAPRRPLPQLAGGRGFGVSVGRGWLPLYVTTGGVCLARNLPTLNFKTAHPGLVPALSTAHP